MIETQTIEHHHDHVGVYEATNQYDPTRTTGLRNRFVQDMRRRFRALTVVIRKAIVDQDGFGLNKFADYQLNPPRRFAFDFPRSVDKVEAFLRWLEQQIDMELLEIGQIQQLGTATEASWMNLYILDSYKRGLIRARYELRNAGYDVPSLEQTGGIEVSMSTPFHLDRVGLLYTRVYNELKGITDAMDKQISVILSQGMIDGDNPRLLARKLVAAINGQGAGDLGLTDSLGRFIPAERRAEILARTEIIRAHHLATVQEYRNWGAQGVNVRAEFVTARDGRVCPICAALDYRLTHRTYSLNEIEGLIPRHPQCRCISLPVLVK